MSNYKNAVAAYINYLKFFTSDEYTKPPLFRQINLLREALCGR